MAFTKKTWKDRVSQYINRRLLTDLYGNTQQVTVTRDEGSVTEAGDAFSAANMNDLENRIEAAIPVVDASLDTTSHNPIENMAVALGLNSKMDSRRIVSTTNGNFDGLVALNDTVYLIACMRLSINASIVLLVHKYNNTMQVKEIVKDSGFSYITNSQGTVAITYSNSSMGVYGGAIKLK